MASSMRAVPAEPANSGAVPMTATFPLTAAPQVAAVLSASEGTVVAQDVVGGLVAPAVHSSQQLDGSALEASLTALTPAGRVAGTRP